MTTDDKQNDVSSTADDKPSSGSAASAPGGGIPTNRELADEAKALGEKLGVEVSTTGLGKAKLVELVEELRLKLEAPSATGDAGAAKNDGGAGSGPAPELAYYVAAGRSISSKRGVIGAGERVRPEDIYGDDAVERLEYLASRGVLEKR